MISRRGALKRLAAGAIVTPFLRPKPAQAALAVGAIAQGSGNGASPTAIFAAPPAAGTYLLCEGWVDAAVAGSVVPGSGWSTLRVHGGAGDWVCVVFAKIAGVGESATQTPWTQSGGNWVLTIWPATGANTTISPGNAIASGLHAAGGISVNGNSAQVPSVAATVPLTAGFASFVATGTTTDSFLKVGGWTNDPDIVFAGSLFLFSHLLNVTASGAVGPRFIFPSATTKADWVGFMVVLTP